MVDTRKFLPTDLVPSAVTACFARHVVSTDRVVVGLSGGIDSVVLLHAVRIRHESVGAIHVHHGINPAADRWEQFCGDLCADWNIPLKVERVEVERNSADGLEAAARHSRHAAFNRHPGDFLVLAHHQDDRAETMLFNLLRGAGVRGAGAMRERNGRLLRPLLSIARDSILGYAQAHGLSWIEDESNADVRFTRNFLRHRILPELQQRFPAAACRLASSAALFAEATDLLDDLAVLDLGDHVPAFPVPVRRLAELPERRARNVLRFLLALKGVGIPSEERLAEALRQLLTAGADRHPAITFGEWILGRDGRQVTLRAR